MKRLNMKKFSVIIFLLIIGGMMCYIYIVSDDIEHKINRHKMIKAGLVTKVEPVIRGDGLWLHYFLLVNNVHVLSKKRVFISSKHSEIVTGILLQKYLPVVLDSTDYSRNEMPITVEDFAKYEMARPDSIKKLYFELDSLKF